MVEKTKYVLLGYSDQLAIVKFEALKDLNNIIFDENMNICAISVNEKTSSQKL